MQEVIHNAREVLLADLVMKEVTVLQSKPKAPPFSYLLAVQNPSLMVNIVFGNVMAGPVLSYQLQDIGKPKTKFFTTRATPDILPALVINECSRFPDIPVVEMNGVVLDLSSVPRELAKFFCQNVLISKSDATALEKRTVLQGESTEWLNEHHKRITASSFGKVLFRVQRPSESMLKGMFKSKDSSNVRSIAHGKAKEKVARTIYSNKMQKRIPQFVVYDAGLTVNPLWPELGASPDGKICDPSDPEPPFGLLEIKCPFTKRDSTINQAATDNSFYLEHRDNNYYLKRNHSCGYFAQVQEQLALTGLKWLDFAVFLPESNELNVDRIYFDDNYWQCILLPKLSSFYFTHALPFLVSQYIGN